MPSHQVQKVEDVHLVGLIGLTELLEVHVLLAILENLCKGEVLNEEVVERVFLRQLQLLINILRQSSQDPLEIFDAHHLIFIIDDKELDIW